VWASFLRRLRSILGAKTRVVAVTFYTRQGCHLCEDARALLRKYESRYRLTVNEVDIDGDPELTALYGDKVPVIAVSGRPRLWGRVNEVLLRRLLAVTADTHR
jgi:glutaredoxin